MIINNKIKIGFTILFFLFVTNNLIAQETLKKDSLTIDETWKLLSTYEKLTQDEGIEMINYIKYSSSDSILYNQLTDSIWTLIFKETELFMLMNRLRIDSLKKIVRDTLNFSLEINQQTINDYNNINFYISYVRDKKRDVLKLQTIDSLIILPSYDQVFDSVYLILQYKEIYLVNKEYSLKNFYHLKRLKYIHETKPYFVNNYKDDTTHIREEARNKNSDGFLFIDLECFFDPCFYIAYVIHNYKNYYKFGRNLVENKHYYKTGSQLTRWK